MKALYAKCTDCDARFGIAFEETKPDHERSARFAIAMAADKHRDETGHEIGAPTLEDYVGSAR